MSALASSSSSSTIAYSGGRVALAKASVSKLKPSLARLATAQGALGKATEALAEALRKVAADEHHSTDVSHASVELADAFSAVAAGRQAAQAARAARTLGARLDAVAKTVVGPMAALLADHAASAKLAHSAKADEDSDRNAATAAEAVASNVPLFERSRTEALRAVMDEVLRAELWVASCAIGRLTPGVAAAYGLDADAGVRQLGEAAAAVSVPRGANLAVCDLRDDTNAPHKKNEPVDAKSKWADGRLAHAAKAAAALKAAAKASGKAHGAVAAAHAALSDALLEVAANEPFVDARLVLADAGQAFASLAQLRKAALVDRAARTVLAKLAAIDTDGAKPLRKILADRDDATRKRIAAAANAQPAAERDAAARAGNTDAILDLNLVMFERSRLTDLLGVENELARAELWYACRACELMPERVRNATSVNPHLAARMSAEDASRDSRR